MTNTTHLTVDSNSDESVDRLNSWIGVAKTAVWVVGLVALGAIKLNSIDNVNANQDEKITRIQEENKVIKATIDNINNKQTEQLVMLTKLITIVEQSPKSYKEK